MAGMRPILCPTLVGRHAELGLLSELCSRLPRGRGGTVVIFGEDGIGKSRLVREAATRARADGQVVLTGRAVQTGNHIAFRPLTEALLAAFRATGPPALPELAPFRTALGRLVPEWHQASGVDHDRSAVLVGEGLLRLLRAVGGRNGCVLVLEDLHWADPDTLAVLEYLSDHLDEESIACLVTLRSDEPGIGLNAAHALVARRTAMPVELSRLGPGEADEMARCCLIASDLEPSLRGVLSRAEGLPFLIEELLASSIGSGALVREGAAWTISSNPTVVIPRTFADTIRRRLNSLGERDAHMLRVAALLGRGFSWSVLGAVLQLDQATVSTGLRRAVDAQLLEVESDGCRFRHALTRDAILGELLPHERADLARAALVVIQQLEPALPEAWCELAAHLAEEAGDRPQVARLLLTIGRRALEAGALSTAEATLEHAHTHATGDVGLIVDIDEVLSEVLAHVGNTDRVFEVSQHLLRMLAEIPGSSRRHAEVHLRLARAAVASNQWSLADKHLTSARELAAPTADARLSARIDVVSAQSALGERRFDEAVALAQAALESAEQVDFAEAACEALEVIGRRARQQDLDEAEAPFAQAFQIAVTHNLPVWRLRALHELGTIDMLRFGGVDRLEQARELAQQSGALGMVAILDLQLAAVRGFRFEPELGIAAARRCAAAARRLQLGVALPRALVQEAACQGFLGRKNEMEAAIREALVLADGDIDVMIGAIGLGRGLYFMFQDRRRAALVELDRAMELVRQQPSVPPYLFRPLWALVRTVEDTGGEVAQSEVRAADVAGVGLNRALLGYAHAVTLGRTGPADAAAAAFVEADHDLLSQGSCEAFRQLARRLVAEAELVDGWGEPVRWLREAATYFEGTGHGRLVAACHSLLRKAGVTTPRRGRGESVVPAALRKLNITSREMDVLVLVAERLPNREIGERLYLSTRTVEKHVEQLLSKTSTHSRSELASVLHSVAAKDAPR